jgi:hypothetical protein
LRPGAGRAQKRQLTQVRSLIYRQEVKSVLSHALCHENMEWIYKSVFLTLALVGSA